MARIGCHTRAMLQNLAADFMHPFPSLPWETALVRLLVAALLGGAIGWEREAHRKPAGLRTHMIVSLAACLFTVLSFELLHFDAAQAEHVRADPLRLIVAVTSGVAFLAAGSIITTGDAVHGLTTGAGMWMAGAIGLACGLGELVLAGMGAGITLCVLWALGKFRLPPR